MRTQDYHELRVLLEDIMQAWPDMKAHPALGAARAYLRTHCHECGMRLSDKQIEEGRELCPACFARLFW
jgi:hypothetical protein